MKVVDTQVMLHRATDYAKETSQQQKRNDVVQQLLKDQGHEEVVRKLTEVQGFEKEEAQQAVNRDGRNAQTADERKNKKGKTKDDSYDAILDEHNPLLAEMSLETSEKFAVPRPRIDIDI